MKITISSVLKERASRLSIVIRGQRKSIKCSQAGIPHMGNADKEIPRESGNVKSGDEGTLEWLLKSKSLSSEF
jgi:hypothetical protein